MSLLPPESPKVLTRLADKYYVERDTFLTKGRGVVYLSPHLLGRIQYDIHRTIHQFPIHLCNVSCHAKQYSQLNLQLGVPFIYPPIILQLNPSRLPRSRGVRLIDKLKFGPTHADKNIVKQGREYMQLQQTFVLYRSLVVFCFVVHRNQALINVSNEQAKWVPVSEISAIGAQYVS